MNEWTDYIFTLITARRADEDVNTDTLDASSTWRGTISTLNRLYVQGSGD